MNENDIQSLLPQKRARCAALSTLIGQSGRQLPEQPAFTAGDVLAESDSLDIFEAKLTAIKESAAHALKDPLSADSLATATAQAEREIAACGAAIKGAGGDVRRRPLLGDFLSTLEKCAALQQHAQNLMRDCREACIEVNVSQSVGTKPNASAKNSARYSGATLKLLQARGVSSIEELSAASTIIPKTGAGGEKLTATERHNLAKGAA